MKKEYIYIILTTIIFSTMEIALKLLSTSINPIQLNFIRFLIGGLFLLPFALKSLRNNNFTIKIKDICSFAFLGFLGIVVSMGLYQLAVIHTKASVVAVLFSSNPIFVTILAFLLLKESVKINNIIALLLDIIGIIVIINPIHTKLSILGVTLTILSTIIFALYGVCGKKKCAKYGGLVVTCFSFLLGSLEMLIFIGISRIDLISSFLTSIGLSTFSKIPLLAGINIDMLPILGFICIVNTGIGFACYFKSMEKNSANMTSLVFFFKPILAPILALIILHESIPVNMIIGIVFILIGSITSILSGTKKNDTHLKMVN